MVANGLRSGHNGLIEPTPPSPPSSSSPLLLLPSTTLSPSSAWEPCSDLHYRGRSALCWHIPSSLAPTMPFLRGRGGNNSPTLIQKISQSLIFLFISFKSNKKMLKDDTFSLIYRVIRLPLQIPQLDKTVIFIY